MCIYFIEKSASHSKRSKIVLVAVQFETVKKRYKIIVFLKYKKKLWELLLWGSSSVNGICTRNLLNDFVQYLLFYVNEVARASDRYLYLALHDIKM